MSAWLHKLKDSLVLASHLALNLEESTFGVTSLFTTGLGPTQIHVMQFFMRFFFMCRQEILMVAMHRQFGKPCHSYTIFVRNTRKFCCSSAILSHKYRSIELSHVQRNDWSKSSSSSTKSAINPPARAHWLFRPISREVVSSSLQECQSLKCACSFFASCLLGESDLCYKTRWA